MDDRRVRVVVAVVLVAIAAVAPTLTSAQAAAGEVPVAMASQSEAESLGEPTSDVWNDTAPADVPLASAPSAVPNASRTAVPAVKVRAARTEERLFLRLSWRDATRDANVSAESRYAAPARTDFADAAAVQLPVNTSARPGIAMGGPGERVNVWYWNPDRGSEELLAAGAGTTTPFAESSVETAATYRGGRWYVVFSRPLVTDGANRTSIRLERDVSVAFAVWDGSNMERSGRKAVSEWQYFPFGPGPQGPPYEAVLWAIAGLAIVVVVLVTTLAVRGT